MRKVGFIHKKANQKGWIERQNCPWNFDARIVYALDSKFSSSSEGNLEVVVFLQDIHALFAKLLSYRC